MGDETELTEPPFETWFRDVVELIKNGGHSMDIVKYKGLWIDYFSEGLTAEYAVKKTIYLLPS